jgi:hypothetical protein
LQHTLTLNIHCFNFQIFSINVTVFETSAVLKRLPQILSLVQLNLTAESVFRTLLLVSKISYKWPCLEIFLQVSRMTSFACEKWIQACDSTLIPSAVSELLMSSERLCFSWGKVFKLNKS